MGIENFLNDFDEQSKKRQEEKSQEEAKKEKQKLDDEKYLVDFQGHYENNIIPELKKIEEKLSNKFDINYNSQPKSAQGTNFYKTDLSPKFEHYIKKIEIQIIAESGRRLITLSGNAYGPENKNLDIDGLHRFQDTVEIFRNINLENEITEVLNKIFLKK